MISAQGISKTFGAVEALKQVDFTLKAGEIHGLVGENGAGKSTLMKILAGVYPPDTGSLYVGNRQVRLGSPHQARQLGIRIVHQEPSLVPTLTVSENLFLHEFYRGNLLPVGRPRLVARARALLQEWALEISPTARAEELPVGKRQLVEIARELSTEGRILILDEPTSSLTDREIDHLFQVLRRLKERQVSIIFISHRLNEVLRIADRVTVLRNAERVDTCPCSELDTGRLIALMLGREISELFPSRAGAGEKVVLSVRDLSGRAFSEISFDLRQGEMLGLAGLLGAGRSELLRALFGLHPLFGGRIELGRKNICPPHPAAAIKQGILLLSESRLDEGIFPDLSVAHNLVMAKLDAVAWKGWLSPRLIRHKVQRLLETLSIVTSHPYRQPVAQLSGGNQQKVVLGRLLGAGPKVLLLDEPTRGVDVGTKAEIHRLMARFVAAGNALLMVSSDLGELTALCHRVLVLYQGRIAGEFQRGRFTEEQILQCAMGVSARRRPET